MSCGKRVIFKVIPAQMVDNASTLCSLPKMLLTRLTSMSTSKLICNVDALKHF